MIEIGVAHVRIFYMYIFLRLFTQSNRALAPTLLKMQIFLNWTRHIHVVKSGGKTYARFTSKLMI